MDLFFKDQSVHFLPNEQTISLEKVQNSLPFDFEGKLEFLSFYTSSDGGVFPYGAFFYRDLFYKVSKGEYNMLDVGCFFRVSEMEVLSNFTISTKCHMFKSINLLSFANDSSGNLYCVAETTGKIYYILHEGQGRITEIAPSFDIFCRNLTGKIR